MPVDALPLVACTLLRTTPIRVFDATISTGFPSAITPDSAVKE